MQVRTTKTASGNTAVQVVERYRHQTKVVKHIGSAASKKDLDALLQLAQEYITAANNTAPLFPELLREEQQLVAIENLVFTRAFHHCAYEFFSFFYALLGFSSLNDPILKDLAIMRLVEPVSKQASLDLLKEYFGVSHGHNKLYKALKQMHKQKKDIEQVAVVYAKKYLSFDFSFVFYDVTTLYFESFKDDDPFRKKGFSKDSKSQQPQILVGLVVTREGFPVSCELFEGNTFEGKTMLPVINNFKNQYAIPTLTIVADAAMLSFKNMQELQKNNLQYIVGARIGSLSDKLTRDIAQAINKIEGIVITRETPHGTLLCDYTKQRAAKDKYDREKQIQRAELRIKQGNPLVQKNRFLKEKTKTIYELNTRLIEKDELLDGIKGYYTNITTLPTELIIARYKDLWHVEKAFRMAKSDLEARPMFHHKKESIQAHMIIVFVSLCIAKAIELRAKLSIAKVKKSIWRILDIEFTDKLTNKTFVKRMDTTGNPMVELWEALQTT